MGKITRITAIVLAVLTIAAMLFGWFVTRAKEMEFYSRDNENLSLFRVADKVGNEYKQIKKTYNEKEGFVPDEDKEIYRALTGISAFFNVAVILAVLAILALAVCIFMMIAGYRIRAFAGQLAGILALFTAIIFVITMASYVRLNDKYMPGNLGDQYQYFGASAWVYITMALGAANFLLSYFQQKSGFCKNTAK